MLSRSEIQDVVAKYDPSSLRVGVLASHSALDICDGAAEEGFRTVAYCQKGREQTYARYYKAHRDKGGKLLRGCVDEALVFEKFRDIMRPPEQMKMRKNSVLFVPNRSLTSYLAVEEVEESFRVPLVGSRGMLRVEERNAQKDYYWLLAQAGLPFPEKVKSPEDIRDLVIVKLHHAVKTLERGFFTCSSPQEYKEKTEALLKAKVITKEALEKARIEKYVIGPIFNFNFFYSPLAAKDKEEPLELLGVDWRFESSLDGFVRLPAEQQLKLPPHQRLPEMTVVGHNTATIRESLLEPVFRHAEKFVEAAKEHFAPGIIGPFCLQTAVDQDMNFVIFDVAPRTGGGTNVHVFSGHPYGNALWRRPMSTGRRLAVEVKRAAAENRLAELVT